LTREFFHLICGDRLGQGVAREVYVLKTDPGYVVKFEVGSIENNRGDFQNAREWDVWHCAPPSAKRWLAPCDSISIHGTILIQRRVTPLLEPPRMVPEWINHDLHCNNWGVINGRPVIVDYGRHKMLEHGFKSMSKMVKRKVTGWSP
jgi:hypothetical protein